MHEMDRAEWRAFVSEGTRTGKISVVRRDGQSLVTPIWFLLDDTDPAPDVDRFVFTTHVSGAKARILQRDPRVCLLVDDQAPPYSYVQLQGTAELRQEDPEMLEWATRLGGRYMGQERAEEYGRRNAVPDELLVRVTVTKVNAVAAISG